MGRRLGGAELLHIDGAVYLLAPVSDAVLDALAPVGADAEDMEPEPVFMAISTLTSI